MLDQLSTEWVRPQPQESAESASLTHMTDDQPGIRRKRSAKGFVYLGLDGKRIADPVTIDRINALAIPPAYEDVWISPDPESHLQATGRDARGRKQYRYHPRWALHRDEVKYSSLVAFAHALPRLRAKVDADLRKPGTPRERVVASVIWLLDNTMIRVGNAAYAKENKSFGLTTLRDRHVKIEGSKVKFAFKGKSGKEWNLQLVDRRMAKIIKAAQDLPGQQLFQYVDADGVRRGVTSQNVNDYIREATGADFTAKHFRTWGGTIAAAAIFATTPLPPSRKHSTRAMNEIIDQVASRLGNTRSVCRKCYIHPAILEGWTGGQLVDAMTRARDSFSQPLEGLDEEETLVLKWLEQMPAAEGATIGLPEA